MHRLLVISALLLGSLAPREASQGQVAPQGSQETLEEALNRMKKPDAGQCILNLFPKDPVMKVGFDSTGNELVFGKDTFHRADIWPEKDLVVGDFKIERVKDSRYAMVAKNINGTPEVQLFAADASGKIVSKKPLATLRAKAVDAKPSQYDGFSALVRFGEPTDKSAQILMLIDDDGAKRHGVVVDVTW